MTTNGLGNLMMTAVIDPGFRRRLLTVPTEIVGDFNLTDDERRFLTSIRASSFTEFAAQLYQWLEERDPIRGRSRNGWRRGGREQKEAASEGEALHQAGSGTTRFPVASPLSGAMPCVQRDVVEEEAIPMPPLRLRSQIKHG